MGYLRVIIVVSAAALFAGCGPNLVLPGTDAASGSDAVPGTDASGGTDALVGCGPDDNGPNEILGPGPDPAGGSFSMMEALEGLPSGPGPLRAIITTSHGDITCILDSTTAPNAVANFVGLARGRRPWLDPATNDWVRRKFYDGLIFHRIIDDFMAQGGDPLGTGFGGPGYSFPDEIGTLTHIPGTLAYANSGPNTNGSQFYITEIATDWLDGGYTIIGYCEPQATIQSLTAVPTGANDLPLVAEMMTVEITRCAP